MDLDLHTCLHLEAVQTPAPSTSETVRWTLIDWYLHVLRVRKEPLLNITSLVVVDAYFSKVTFVDGALEIGFYVISRLRDDASLRCLTRQSPKVGRGRPRQCDGKIDIENLDESRFEIISLDNGRARILSAVVNSVSLKRNIRLYIWQSADGKIHKLYPHATIHFRVRDQAKRRIKSKAVGGRN